MKSESYIFDLGPEHLGKVCKYLTFPCMQT